MKKILVIHGSARKANTWGITQKVMREMSSLGEFSFDEINLHDLKLPFCKGCMICINKDEKLCAHKEIQEIETRLQQADALIISSPTYIMNLNAELKNLLDHFAYRFHRPSYFDKKALVISSTAGAGAAGTAGFIRKTLLSMGFNVVHRLPIVCWDIEYKESPASKKKIESAAQRFAKDVLSAKLHHPGWYQLGLYTAFRSNATGGARLQTADHIYWRDNDMLTRVYPNKTGIIKHLCASFIFKLMSLIIPAR